MLKQNAENVQDVKDEKANEDASVGGEDVSVCSNDLRKEEADALVLIKEHRNSVKATYYEDQIARIISSLEDPQADFPQRVEQEFNKSQYAKEHTHMFQMITRTLVICKRKTNR